MEYDEQVLKIGGYAVQSHIVKLNQQDMAWCRENVDPLVAEVEDLVNMARVDVDRELLSKFAHTANNHMVRHYRHINRYPEGYCLDITEGVLDRITNFSKEDDHKVADLVKRMKENQIALDRVYVISTGSGTNRTFQNAIQFGNKIIDCAWDTGKDTSLRQVYIYDVNGDHPYENIDSFEQYAAVKSKYNMQEIFPIMQHMPYLAPMIPAIGVLPSGSIEFIVTGDLFFTNLATNQRLARQFYQKLARESHQKREFNIEPMSELPRKIREFLRRHCKDGVFKYFDCPSITPEYAFEMAREYYAGILTSKMPLEVKKARVENGENILKTAEKLENLSKWEFD